MANFVLLAGAATGMSALIFGLSRMRLRNRIRERFLSPEVSAASAAPPQRLKARVRPVLRRHRIIPWMLAALVGCVLLLGFEFPVSYSLAFATMAGLLTTQLEGFVATRREAKVESQLAEAIDLMVGALGAGAGATTALEAAITETKEPLKSQLREVLGRIRLGDDPQVVFRVLAQRVPLETFLLFATTLATHWEVGGSLAPTLSTIGRSIRDRIEVSRRIRSNAAQSQFSTAAVLGLTYFIALIMWRTNPEQMHAMLATSIGGWFVAATVVLQCVGILWMSQISRPRF